MAVIGYTVSAHDNNSFYLDTEKPTDAPICVQCGYLMDPVIYYNPFFKIKKKILDFSYTYDNRAIVSLKFKEFCNRNNYEDITFKSFERDLEYFQFLVGNILPVDIENSDINFENYCNACQRWEGVFVKKLSIKDNLSNLKDGFYRTDLLFSQGNRKNPIFIIGIETYEKVKKEKLKGLIFDAIYTR